MAAVTLSHREKDGSLIAIWAVPAPLDPVAR
jgi:hypothetical protein